MLHRAYVSSEKSILRMVAAAAAVADNNLQQRRSAKPPKHETTVAGNIFSSAFEQHDNRIGENKNPEWAATIVAASRITKQRGRRKRRVAQHSNVFLWLCLVLLLLLFLTVVVGWVIVYHAVLVRKTTTQHSTAVYLASPKAISQPTTDTFRWDASSGVLGAPPPDDAILGIAMAYQACTNPHKVHVAVGAYRTCAHIHT